MTKAPRSTALAVGTELFQMGDQVGDLGLILDAGKCHARARRHCARIAYIEAEIVLVPCLLDRLLGVGTVETVDTSGATAKDTVKLRTNETARRWTNLVAGTALRKNPLARGGILCVGVARRYQRQSDKRGEEAKIRGVRGMGGMGRSSFER